MVMVPIGQSQMASGRQKASVLLFLYSEEERISGAQVFAWIRYHKKLHSKAGCKFDAVSQAMKRHDW